jgi:hypothetical protein
MPRRLLLIAVCFAWQILCISDERAGIVWAAEETVIETFDPPGRLLVNSPVDGDACRQQVRVLLYALPNGNTIEQTLGCKMTPGLDWHYDIQHVAAQVRMLRELNPNERLVLVCAEAGGLSWPTWRSSRIDGNERIRRLLDDWRMQFGGKEARVTLTGHSGGGSFIFGAIEGGEEIPPYIDRIAILDANYAFDDAKHTDKLVRWLSGDVSRRLVVLAYDDRNIELNGKKVVGPDGGTFRATQRMVEALKPHFALEESQSGPFTEYSGLDGRVRFYVHPNPQNKILHTALVGDMNGLAHAQTLGTAAEGKWGQFGGPRAFTKFIQDEPASEASRIGAGQSTTRPALSRLIRRAADRLPGADARERPIGMLYNRPKDAIGGRAFMDSIANLPPAKREEAIFEQIKKCNIPEFLRKLQTVPVASAGVNDFAKLDCSMKVMPDYLAIGSDQDFVRIPMTPQTAQRLADHFSCILPTRKMVGAIDAVAKARLDPQPLTEDRESVAAFVLSNEKIERQRAGQPLGALTIGTKKDIVLTPKIHERPDRVAIYGWRRLDGTPIQPLTTVHVNSYVDYSHGVRLVFDVLYMNGKPGPRISELLRDRERCELFSDEGPIDPPRYPVSK